MKKKRSRLSCFEEVIGNYGKSFSNRNCRKVVPATLVISKSFDQGEVLVQNSTLTQAYFEEYVVQQSIQDVEFEEYVVQSSVPESTSLHSMAEAMSNVSDASMVNAEYKVNLMDPLAIEDQVTPDGLAWKMGEVVPGTPLGMEGARPTVPSNLEESTQPKVSDDDFTADMEAILKGEKVYDPVSKKMMDKNQAVNSQSGSRDRLPNPAPVQPISNEHAIFDKIAQSMQYANAYDLGTVDLDKRFSDFDLIADLEKPPQKKENAIPIAEDSRSPAKTITSADFLEDLEAIKKMNPPSDSDLAVAKSELDPKDVNWPPRPSTVRPYTMAEKKEAFGGFEFEPDPSTEGGDGIKVLGTWKADNIKSVSIPQLEGKIYGSYPNGKRLSRDQSKIEFHKNGAQKLQDLWKAWEDAGLLDRVLTFSAGYVPRFVRGTQNNHPRPLSNHAFGTAFDINVQWNHRGSTPAITGDIGSTRELVQIANQYGFFWGGHFGGSAVDGMHFELGRIL